MKIKSLICSLLAIVCLGSCAKDGSRTIQLDEFAAVELFYTHHTMDESKKVSELFSIVPGEYKISWKVKDELPQMTNYSGTMVLKLRLNKKLNVKDDFIKEANYVRCPTFAFVDADGKKMNETDTWYLSMDGVTGHTNEDQFMDYVKFLQSEPGTEMELSLGSMLVECSGEHYAHHISDIQKAKGLMLIIHQTDEEFCRYIAEFVE